MKTIENPLSLATTSDRLSVTGKLLGTRTTFAGSASASELKTKFKAQGLKGKKLEMAIQKVLRGEASVRQVVGVAVVQARIAEGWVPDVMKTNKAGTKSTLDFVKVEKLKISAEEVAALPEDDQDTLLKALQQAKLDREAAAQTIEMQ